MKVVDWENGTVVLYNFFYGAASWPLNELMHASFACVSAPA